MFIWKTSYKIYRLDFVKEIKNLINKNNQNLVEKRDIVLNFCLQKINKIMMIKIIFKNVKENKIKKEKIIYLINSY